MEINKERAVVMTARIYHQAVADTYSEQAAVRRAASRTVWLRDCTAAVENIMPAA